MGAENHQVRILIVEDESLLAQDIAQRLQEMGYKIAGIAKNAERALQILGTSPEADIILIDIMLSGPKDGIELARDINKRYSIPFIFLTAHTNSYLMERVKSVYPSAFLLKPFNDRQVAAAIELALYNYASDSKKETIPEENEHVLKINDSLFLKKNERFDRVPFSDIQMFEADDNYTTIHTKSNKYIYSTVLKRIEAQLPKSRFLRIHRSYVINIDSISGYQGNMLFIGPHKVPVSKSHRDQVFKLFDTI